MSEIHLRHPGFTYSEYKKLRKQEIYDIFIKTN